MINKLYSSAAEALADVTGGSTVLVGGFGGSGLPLHLVEALADQGARELTLVSNNVGAAGEGIAVLIKNRQVRKVICSFPQGRHAEHFLEMYRAGQIEIELIPQGTLAERIRAGGAGIPAFFTPAGAETEVAEGKEVRVFDGRPHLLEHAIEADYALIKAYRADRWGNLTYRKAQRNFNVVMAAAARTTVAEVNEVLELGELDPEEVVTPSIFVHRLVQVPYEPIWRGE